MPSVDKRKIKSTDDTEKRTIQLNDMRKTKATKKSGTIAYQLNPRFDLQGEASEQNPLMGVSVVPSTPVTTKDMAERIGYATSVNKLM